MSGLRFSENGLTGADEAHENDQIPEIKLVAARKRLTAELQRLTVQGKLGGDVARDAAAAAANLAKVEAEFERRRQGARRGSGGVEAAKGGQGGAQEGSKSAIEKRRK